VNEAASLIKAAAHPDCNVIFGAVVDEGMKDQVRITVIATGFDHQGTVPRRVIRQNTSNTTRTTTARYSAAVSVASAAREAEDTARQSQLDPDNLELPSFLRRR
jgi:cell division protein FtsZ